MGIFDRFKKRTEEPYRMIKVPYITIERSHFCPCGGKLKEFSEQGILLTKCEKCSAVSPIKGAIYDADVLIKIASKFSNFRL